MVFLLECCKSYTFIKCIWWRWYIFLVHQLSTFDSNQNVRPHIDTLINFNDKKHKRSECATNFNRCIDTRKKNNALIHTPGLCEAVICVSKSLCVFDDFERAGNYLLSLINIQQINGFKILSSSMPSNMSAYVIKHDDAMTNNTYKTHKCIVPIWYASKVRCHAHKQTKHKNKNTLQQKNIRSYKRIIYANTNTGITERI